MSSKIPCTPDGKSNLIQRTSFGGREYQLEFLWSQRGGRWTLTLSDQDGSVITVIRLVTNWPMLHRVVDARRPPGELIVVDTQGENADPTFSGLGGRFQLLYLEPSDLTA